MPSEPTMRLHEHFEWDMDKAKSNHEKHHVTFEDAAAVLGDDQGDALHIEGYDDAHSLGEDRSPSGRPSHHPENLLD